MSIVSEIARYRALSRDVLAVALDRRDGSWSAYIGAVAGACHDEEWETVLKAGKKLDERVALAIFPGCVGRRYVF